MTRLALLAAVTAMVACSDPASNDASPSPSSTPLGSSAPACPSPPSVDGGANGGGDANGNGDADTGPSDPLDPVYMPPIDTNPADYPANVWTTTAMAKVRPSDPPGPTHWALLSAARNEVESFQVHVHAGAATSALSIAVSDLKDARGGGTIASSSIVVSRERTLTITAGDVSDANGMTGEIPDALVPARDTLYGEARNAFPVDVAAGRNASAWIDVRVPLGTPSGWYVGAVTVTANGATLATLPIRLKVWQVDLPATASLRSHFGMSWDGACAQYYGSYAACGAFTGGSADDGVEATHLDVARFALDRRVSISGVVYYGPSNDDWSHFDALYAPLLDGTAKTAIAGAKLTGVDFTGNTGDDAAIARWASHFASKGWLDRLSFYHCDEPASGRQCTFADALAEEQRVHGDAPDLLRLLTADVEDITKGGLLDTVDVLVPTIDQMQPHGDASQRPAYDPFLAEAPTKRLYWYQSCDQHESCDTGGTPGPKTATWPSYMADASPTRNRVFQWMAYLFAVSGELYYTTDLCWVQPCGPSGAQTSDPLQSIYAFSGHGDGTLIYPGRPSDIGGTHPIPLSSIRFELIRDGMEDYELLHALDAAGDGAFAKQQAQSFIRRADDFDDDPTHLQTAREALGDRLHARSL